jgi:hypothetical protein
MDFDDLLSSFGEHIVRRYFLLLDCTVGAQSCANQFGRLRGVVETIAESPTIRLSIELETALVGHKAATPSGLRVKD